MYTIMLVCESFSRFTDSDGIGLGRGSSPPGGSLLREARVLPGRALGGPRPAVRDTHGSLKPWRSPNSVERALHEPHQSINLYIRARLNRYTEGKKDLDKLVTAVKSTWSNWKRGVEDGDIAATFKFFLNGTNTTYSIRVKSTIHLHLIHQSHQDLFA